MCGGGGVGLGGVGLKASSIRITSPSQGANALWDINLRPF